MAKLWLISLFLIAQLTPYSATAASEQNGQKMHWQINSLTQQQQSEINGSHYGVRRPRTRIGGSRGGSEAVALVPRINERVVGTTINPQPTLWFYINAQSTQTYQLTLTPLDQSRQPWRSEKISVQATGSGLLPVVYRGTPLQDGWYKWTFEQQAAPPLSGLVHKVSDPQLAAMTASFDRMVKYADRGIWYDLLTDLLNARRRTPKNPQIEAAWRSLIFESASVKFNKPDTETEDVELMTAIIRAPVIIP